MRKLIKRLIAWIDSWEATWKPCGICNSCCNGDPIRCWTLSD